ncbi:hypothetical protein NADFUDRAFT_83673 [Nadsonia fulvescens var. elongata DSM 6958]|uniref:Uncharacterized protein n=1 Tax=Nadsonia fulvescens var. elongata DSM 6958 TaxID=857566 RepID=A0A1E3PIN6_9ASCO|nr:hypothetical protein NADFUDRAFT_83673 [Nadsonia fulvescens var. elongata DSM 6958]
MDRSYCVIDPDDGDNDGDITLSPSSTSTSESEARFPFSLESDGITLSPEDTDLDSSPRASSPQLTTHPESILAEESLSSTIYYVESTSPGIISPTESQDGWGTFRPPSPPSPPYYSSPSPMRWSPFFQPVHLQTTDDAKSYYRDDNIVIPEIECENQENVGIRRFRILFIGEHTSNPSQKSQHLDLKMPRSPRTSNTGHISQCGSIEAVVGRVKSALKRDSEVLIISKFSHSTMKPGSTASAKEDPKPLVQEYVYSRSKEDVRETPTWLEEGDNIPTVAFTYYAEVEMASTSIARLNCLELLKQHNVPLFTIALDGYSTLAPQDGLSNSNANKTVFFSLAAPHIKQNTPLTRAEPCISDYCCLEDYFNKKVSWHNMFPMNFSRFSEMTDESLRKWIYNITFSTTLTQETIYPVNIGSYPTFEVEEPSKVAEKKLSWYANNRPINEKDKLIRWVLIMLTPLILGLLSFFLVMRPEMRFSVLSISSRKSSPDGPAFFLNLTSLVKDSNAIKLAQGIFSAGQIVASCPALKHPLLNGCDRRSEVLLEHQNQAIVGNIVLIPIIYDDKQFKVLTDVSMQRIEPTSILIQRITSLDGNTTCIDLSKSCLALVEVKRPLNEKFQRFLSAVDGNNLPQLAWYLTKLANIDLLQHWRDCCDYSGEQLGLTLPNGDYSTTVNIKQIKNKISAKLPNLDPDMAHHTIDRALMAANKIWTMIATNFWLVSSELADSRKWVINESLNHVKSMTTCISSLFKDFGTIESNSTEGMERLRGKIKKLTLTNSLISMMPLGSKWVSKQITKLSNFSPIKKLPSWSQDSVEVIGSALGKLWSLWLRAQEFRMKLLTRVGQDAKISVWWLGETLGYTYGWLFTNLEAETKVLGSAGQDSKMMSLLSQDLNRTLNSAYEILSNQWSMALGLCRTISPW